eukprot:m.123873 g.123873  ORF g.123873 m.123873 type:complete len:586 (-) comp16268_c0_seq1:127-1884(-)
MDLKDVLLTACSAVDVAAADYGSATLASLDEIDRKSECEASFRRAMQALRFNHRSDQRLHRNLLELAFRAVKEGNAEPAMLYNVLDDMFDSMTIAECEHHFAFLEDHMVDLGLPPFDKASKTRLLRFCNGVQRRLSKSQNVSLRGRILRFLASVIPITEQSGVNLNSALNEDNKTVFETEEETEEKNDADAAIASADEMKRTVKSVDRARYRQFWSVQSFFSRPLDCFDNAKWKQFVESSESIFDLFSREKLQADAPINNSNNNTAAASHATPSEVVAAAAAASTGAVAETAAATAAEEHQYFAKFLTSPKLFALQLADANFRRQILVQYLILFQFLSIPSKARKEQYKLAAAQEDFVKSARTRVFNLLSETPPDAEHFIAGIKDLLAKEERWVAWKVAGCKPFELGPKKQDDATETGTAIRSKRFKPAERTKINITPSEPNLLADCAAANRKFTPTTDAFFEEAIEQVIPENDVEESYWDINKADYNWVALRLLARANIRVFQELTDKHKTMKEFLKQALLKMAGTRGETGMDGGAPAVAMDVTADGAADGAAEGATAEAATEPAQEDASVAQQQQQQVTTEEA